VSSLLSGSSLTISADNIRAPRFLWDALWDFAVFRPFLWDLWENRGAPSHVRDNFEVNFSLPTAAENPRVTRTDLIDSIQALQKLLVITYTVNNYTVNGGRFAPQLPGHAAPGELKRGIDKALRALPK
jgi:hypothetical protein